MDSLSGAGRFLASTGKGALRKVGEGARAVKRVAGQVDKATGGMAGAMFEGSKSLPGVGVVTRNAEQGLNMAAKYADLGVKGIELGERAAKTRSLTGAVGVAKDAKSLARQFRP
jgi:hypothetical protein